MMHHIQQKLLALKQMLASFCESLVNVREPCLQERVSKKQPILNDTEPLAYRKSSAKQTRSEHSSS